jgi:hypothetical protein
MAASVAQAAATPSAAASQKEVTDEPGTERADEGELRDQIRELMKEATGFFEA